MGKEINLSDLTKPIESDNLLFRVKSISKNGYALIFAYKDARIDMQRLDEVCSPENWQREHRDYKGVMYCGIGIKIKENWVWKWDAGAESYSDKEKGESSDSFKRAGFNWGIGRELYSYPKIIIKLNENEFQIGDNEVRQTKNLKLNNWNWDVKFHEKKVKNISAFDQYGILRFEFPKNDFKSKNGPSDLEIALEYVSGCKDITTLQDLWNDHIQFHDNKDFVNHVKKIKQKIQNEKSNITINSGCS